MTTAEALEVMNEAEFELLAVRSLRELEPDCRAVIHLGTNAQGKTIPGPLDGFCRVPSVTPPRFVLIAATTTKIKKLKNKWLSSGTIEEHKTTSSRVKPVKGRNGRDLPAGEGDLPKAAKEAVLLRRDYPKASFILYLATNRNLSLDLESAARTAGDLEGIEVRFLEQSRLRDFLDIKPTGQWLRQEHLGIEADQVSLPLIQQICKENLVRYSKDVAIFDEIAAVETRSSRAILGRVNDPSVCLHLLVGSSGVGKSVAALGVLEHHVASGGIGIWLSSDAVEMSLSLADAVRAVLTSIHPNLGRDAGVSTIALGAEHGPIILVVDDVNRSNSPPRVLKKLLSWMRPEPSNNNDVRTAYRVHVLCPLWVSCWSGVSSEAESKDWIDVQHVSRFTRSESIALIKTAPRLFSEFDIESYAAALQDDPILVGLFARMLREYPASDPLDLCHDAIGGFIRRSVDDLALTRSEASESYISAVQELSRQMVMRRAFHPDWIQVQGWFAHNPFGLLRLEALAGQGHICNIKERNGNKVLEFRHDRLLEFFISRALGTILLGPEADRDSAFDPYYVPLLGNCLAHTAFKDEILDEVLNRSPAALVASLRCISPSLGCYTKQVVSRAASWLPNCRQFSATKRHAVQILRDSESPFTLEVTEKCKDDRFLWDARLRCGDAYAGALSLSVGFSPASLNSWIEEVIEQASVNHHEEIAGGVATILLRSEESVAVLRGALTLAGYLGDASLGRAISACWAEASQDVKTKVLLQALWAGLRCSSDDPNGMLSPMLEALLALDDDRKGNEAISERGRVCLEIGPAGRHGFSVPVLQFLVEIGGNEEFEKIVVVLLERADHPIAVRYVTETLARWTERAHRAKSINPFAISWKEKWEAKHGGRRISFESLTELRSVWEDTRRPEWLRSYAFACWAELSPDIKSLGTAPPASYPTDRSSVWSRARAGDRSATKEYLDYLSRDWHWLYAMPEIWSSELLPIASDWLARIREISRAAHSDTEYALARLIRDIPVADGEALLTRHWDVLGNRPQFVQAALHVSSDRIRELVRKSLAEWSYEEDPFEDIDRFFFTGFYKISPDDRLSLRQLEGLCPYLDRLNSKMLGQMLAFCGNRGYFEFARTHLLPECRIRLAQSESPNVEDASLRRSMHDWFPTTADLANELSRIAVEEEHVKALQVKMWIQRFLKTDQPQELIFKTLQDWLTESPTEARFVVSAIVVRYWGKRLHLGILESCSYTGSEKGRVLLDDCRYDVCRRSLE